VAQSFRAVFVSLLLLTLCHRANAQVAPDVSAVQVERTSSDLPANWSNSAAFMEVFVRSYRDSDGDGIGDLPTTIMAMRKRTIGVSRLNMEPWRTSNYC
jgi:hypothetical protein